MTQTPYRVLARKYRPQDFDDLVGQEVLVRTLSNAIESGRIAQAYLLTGIRGIGKTTTARIIARALNCIGPDGQGGPTIHPCGVCPNCKMIAEDRHVDVLEMDAASNGGIDKIRDLIDGVHYAPTSARYKVYIVDEVHMLSGPAFNALLKTLEEPPPSVVFIFATTEIRKIPVTILSRCQRFDLKRLSVEGLAEHLANVSAKEALSAEPEALELIAMAAEGSVRDGLSLLDRAVAHGGADGAVKAVEIRAMLGLADRSRLFDLLGTVFAGDAAAALEKLRGQYEDGAEMAMLLGDLLGLVHVLSRLHVAPASDLGAGFSETERGLADSLAKTVAVPELSRAWQMLLKGLDETKRAPDPMAAAEMVIIRLCHAARLPLPGDLVREALEGGSGGRPGGQVGGRSAPTGTTMSGAAMPPASGSVASNDFGARPTAGGRSGALALAVHHETAIVAADTMATPSHLTLAAHNPPIRIGDFEAVAELLERRGEMILLAEWSNQVEPVSLGDEMMRVHFLPAAKADLAARLKGVFDEATGRRWTIEPSAERGQPTIAARREAEKRARWERAESHPSVRAVLEAFPGSRMLGFVSDKGEKP